jgi:hypothetical protein
VGYGPLPHFTLYTLILNPVVVELALEQFELLELDLTPSSEGRSRGVVWTLPFRVAGCRVCLARR